MRVRTKTVVHRVGLKFCLYPVKTSAHLFEQACTPLYCNFSELSTSFCRSYILSGWLMIYSLFSWAILWFHHINSSLVSFLEYLECYLLFGLPQTSVEWDLSHDLFDLFEGRKAKAHFWWEEVASEKISYSLQNQLQTLSLLQNDTKGQCSHRKRLYAPKGTARPGFGQ